MATFQYRCEQDGDFELVFAVGKADAAAPCPTCRYPARRRFSPPMLSLAPVGLVSAIERTESTGDSPAVVSAPPRQTGGGRTVPASRIAALRGLPRP